MQDAPTIQATPMPHAPLIPTTLMQDAPFIPTTPAMPAMSITPTLPPQLRKQPLSTRRKRVAMAATPAASVASDSNAASVIAAKSVAAASASSAAATAAAPVRSVPEVADTHPALRRWVARMQRLGMSQPQMVWELHVRQAWPLLDIAETLGTDLPSVSQHWRTLREQISERAPRTEADWLLLRERIGDTLWRTVEMTFETDHAQEKSGTAADAAAENAALPSPPQPPPTPAPVMSVRLKALDQLAKLYGLTLDPADTTTVPKAYDTPEEIAEAVRLRVLELHGRRELAGGLGLGGGMNETASCAEDC